MAGHFSNWIKVGSGAGQMVSSKGNVYVSSASLTKYGLSKADLALMPAEAILKLARQSQQPRGQARPSPNRSATPVTAPGTTPEATPDPLATLSPTLRKGAEKAANGKTPGQAANRFRTMLGTAGKASAALAEMVSVPGKLTAQGLAQLMVQLPAPTRRALIVAAGGAAIAATATGVAPPVIAVAVLAAAGSIAAGKVVEPGGKPKKKPAAKKPVPKKPVAKKA